MIGKKHLSLVALLISCGSLLHGDYTSNFDVEIPARSRQECCSQPTCCETSSGRFFVRGDLLYWKPHVSGLELDFGTSSIAKNTAGGVEMFAMEEHDKDPRFKWNAGYRVAAGYQSACNWEIGALWTHFQGNGHRKDHEDVNTVNHGKCHLKFDQIDVIGAYQSSLTSSFSFKPFIGVRGAEIHERVSALIVTNIAINPPPALATETRALRDRQKYWGVGPILGLHGDWDLGCGFGIYGTAAAAVLYGKYKVRFEDADVMTPPISKEIASLNRRDLHRFDGNIDLAIGIRWQTCITDALQLSMKLGFEHHQYFNQSHLGTNRGDLSFDGLVFSIGLGL